jgi:hypothetical protein
VPYTYCDPGPIRALFIQDNRRFTVSGAFFYEILGSRNVVIRGQVREDAYPATISSNGPGGFQLFITSGRVGYIYNLTTNAFQTIGDPDFPSPCNMGLFSDGYFLALRSQSNDFAVSKAEDGLIWNGLDVAQTTLSSDLKLSFAISHRELWIFGSKYTEVWAPDANAVPPYSPIPGVFIEHGIAAPYSVVRMDNTLYWLGQDESGTGVVWRANGYTPEHISDHAVDGVIQSWPRLDNTFAFAFQVEGHLWYALYSPYNDTTWMYDIASQQWTEWAIWDNQLLRYRPWIGRCAASGGGLTLIGDRQSGTIYELRTDVFQDTLVIQDGL